MEPVESVVSVVVQHRMEPVESVVSAVVQRQLEPVESVVSAVVQHRIPVVESELGIPYGGTGIYYHGIRLRDIGFDNFLHDRFHDATTSYRNNIHTMEEHTGNWTK